VKSGALLFLATAASWVSATAQTDGSVGLGIGTVRDTGGANVSTATLSSAFRVASPTLVADFSGSVASLVHAVWVGQGRTDLWGVTAPLASRLRAGAEVTLAGTARSDGGSTAAGHAVAEFLWSARTWGVGIGAGPSTGLISDELPVVALHTRARLWWRPERAGAPDVQLSVEPTRFPDFWFTDASLAATRERGRAIVSLWVAGRMSPAFPAEGAGGAFLQVFATPSVSFEVSAGRYLPEPYQGFPQVGFVSVGVRLHHPARVPRVELSPLVPGMRGDSLVLRFRMAGARSVAIAGDWSSWQQVALRPLGDDVWEGVLGLRRGLYHFNLLVDGSDWVVPNGVATVPDGMGGMVAVLIVP
jgi:Glycogen recognition site of AMP-activated protein kinase